MTGRVSLAVFVLAIIGVTLMRGRRPQRERELAPSGLDAVLASHRKAVGWRWAGLSLGAVAATLTARTGSLGLGVMLAPTVFGLCVIGGALVGELATIPRRSVGTVALKTRSVGKYLPRRLGALVMASTIGLGALLVTTTRMGSGDLSRVGRVVFRACGAERSAAYGPWPGLFYAVPLGIAVMIGLLGAGVALRTVVLRPRVGSAPNLVVADDALRRRSAEAVVAATGVMVTASLFGVALSALGALVSSACPPTSWTALGVTLLTIGVLTLLAATWCLVLLLSGPRIDPTRESGDKAVAGQEPVDELGAGPHP
jgi:hypothetical protein